MKLEGIYPAVVTPLTEDERFAPAAFERLIDRMYASGSHGLYVCGQTGEGLLLPVSVREQVAEAAVRCSPAGKTVVVHVGAATTADAIHLARHAERSGAHGISSLPPIGNYTFAEYRSYYQKLAAATNLPLLVYFFPEIAPNITSTEQILELCSIPRVAGLKFTDFDLFKLARLRSQGHVVFNGRDEILVAGLLMGANGGIGTFYNLVPELFVQVFTLSQSGQWKEARAVQERINELIRITLQYPLFPAVKRILGWTGVEAGPCVEPRRRLTSEEDDQLRSDLLNAGFSSLCGVHASAS